MVKQYDDDLYAMPIDLAMEREISMLGEGFRMLNPGTIPTSIEDELERGIKSTLYIKQQSIPPYITFKNKSKPQKS